MRRWSQCFIPTLVHAFPFGNSNTLPLGFTDNHPLAGANLESFRDKFEVLYRFVD